MPDFDLGVLIGIAMCLGVVAVLKGMGWVFRVNTAIRKMERQDNA